MKDEDGLVTIKCNKYFRYSKRDVSFDGCYNASNSLCPFNNINVYSDKSICKKGEVTLEWMDYIKFNNYMKKEFRPTKK